MRTTAENVKAVMDTALEDSEIQVLISVANRIVTDRLGAASLTPATLLDIETWMTAHLIAIGKERQASKEKLDDLEIVFQGKFGESLKSTTFGQMVILLDSSGLMADAAKLKARIRATPQYPEDYE